MNWDFSQLKDKDRDQTVRKQIEGIDFSSLEEGGTIYSGNKYWYKGDVYIAKETHELSSDWDSLFFDVSKFELITKSANIGILSQTGLGIDFVEGQPISINKEFSNYEISRSNNPSLQHIGIVHKILSSTAIQIAFEGLITPYGDWSNDLIGSDFYIDEDGAYTTVNTGLFAFQKLGHKLLLGGQEVPSQMIPLGQFVPESVSLTASGKYNEYVAESNISINIVSQIKDVKQKVKLRLSGQNITIPDNSIILNNSFQDGIAPPVGTYILEIGYNGDEYEFELKQVTIKSPTFDKTTLLHFIVMGQSQALGDDGRPKLGHSTDPNVLMLGNSQRIDHNSSESEIKSLTLNTCIEGIPNVDTIALAFGRELLSLINDTRYKICITISGVGGRDIVALSKGGNEGTYEAALYAAQRVKDLSDLNNWDYEVHHIWMHGGHAGVDYYNQLVAHINNFRDDFGGITTQTRPVYVIMDQIRQRNNFTIEPSHKMVEVMQSLNNVVISHPRYSVEYHEPDTPDSVHLTSNGQRHTACFFAYASYCKLFNIEYEPLIIKDIAWDAIHRRFIISFNNTNQLFGSGNYGLRLYNVTTEQSIIISNIDLVNNKVELTPENISVGEYTIRIETMFRDSDEEWKWYPDFDLDPELGYLYEVNSHTPIFVDTNTNIPYRLDKYLLRSSQEIDIEVTASGENQKPTVFDLHIINTNAATGEIEAGKTISAGYTYNDFDGDHEGNSVIKWFIADDSEGTNEQIIISENLVIISGYIGKYIDFEVTPIAQTGVTEGDPVRLGYQGPVVPLSAINLENRRIQIHLDRYNSPDDTEPDNYFNGISTKNATSGQVVAQTLLDNKKNIIPITMRVVAPPWGEATTSNLHAPVDDFPYPESVVRNMASHNKYHTDPCIYEFEANWDSNKTYKLTIWGTTNKEATTVIVDVRVQGKSKTLDTYQNIDNTVVFDGIQPDNNGIIRIAFAKADIETIYSVIFNLIIIEESDIEPGENLPPSASNVAFTGSLIENNTITATWDYDDPDGDAEGDSIVKFIIADDEEGTNETEEQSGTSNEFTLSESYIGKYLDIRVTPHAATGESPGSEVSMGFVGPVLEEGEVVTPPVLLRRNKAQAGNWIGNMGFWEFQPRNFNPNQQYPILIFFHGAGEPGNGIEDLDILITPGKGLGSVINKDIEAFADKVGDMVCIVPQCFTWSWPSHQGRLPVEAALQQSYIDSNRIYMTGLSAGGWGIHDLFGIPEIAASIAAAVPIATKWTTNQLDNNYMNNALHVPFWYFHGTADTSPNRYVDIKTHIEMFNGLNPTTPAKLTGMIGRGHTAAVWDNVYDDNRNASLSLDEPYEVGWNQSIYDWLKQFVLGQTPIPQLNTPDIELFASISEVVSVTIIDTNDNPNESGFELHFREVGVDSGWTILPKDPDVENFTLHGLGINTTWEFKIKAIGDGVNTRDSLFSNIKTITTGQAPTLSTPTGFEVVPGDEKNTLSWNPVQNAEEYTVRFHTGDFNWQLLPNYNGTATSNVEHLGLTNGVTYHYEVKAVAEGYIVSQPATGNATPQEIVQPDGLRVLIDIGDSDTQTTIFQGNVWNNAHGTVQNKNMTTDGYEVTNLVDVGGNPTGINWKLTKAADDDYGGANAGGVNYEGMNQDVGDYPASAVVDSHFTNSTGDGGIMTLSGFNPAKVYKIKHFGSRNAASPRSIEIATNPDFEDSQIYDAAFNTDYDNCAEFEITGVSSVDFYMRSVNGQFGYVGVIDIRGVTPVPQLNTPGSFNASSASSTSLALTWTDPNDNPNEVNFEINYRVQGTSSWTQKIVAQDATSDTLSGLANSTTYECRIRSIGDDENSLHSPWSSIVTATTGQQAQLATPTGFSVVAGNEKNTISWNAVANAESYELEFHDGDGNWTAVPGYNGTDISDIEHTGLTNGTTYYYRVIAKADGYVPSNAATSSGGLTKLIAPILSSATAVESGIKIEFTDPNSDPNEETYEVQHSTYSDFSNLVNKVTIGPNKTSHTIMGLAPHAIHYIRVVAKGNGTTTADSDFSNVLSSTTNIVQTDLRVLIDFGWTSNQTTEPFQGNVWNNIHADKSNKNLSDPLGPVSLVNVEGNTSGISWEQTQPGDNDYGSPNHSGANENGGVNQDVGDYPATACIDSAFVYNRNGLPAIWVISGLTSSKIYDIDFWGAREAAAPRGIEISMNSDFSDSQTYEAANNTNYENRASFRIGGVTSVTFYLRPASGSTFGYVSVVDIKEV